MTIEDLKSKNLILLECISGSKAYGLDTPSSDTDIKGVFILPEKEFYTSNYIPQISNSSNDIVYYELGRYLELLALNNPNILELLNTPKNCILQKHPLLDEIDTQYIISKLCKNTFGKFAISQLKKARGLKKKILNPVDKIKKNPLDFCYINYQNGALPLKKWLALKSWHHQNCGLVNIPNMKDIYGLYYSENDIYNGIIKHNTSNSIALSSIPKDAKQEALLYYNKDGYSVYCKEYKEYWDWVKNRNESRYQNTKSHGKNYDAKNMMHTFRLLEMAIEIAIEGKINVKRNDRPFLLAIKSGQYEYQDLMNLAKEKQVKMEDAFKHSSIRELPDTSWLKNITYSIRKRLYK